MQKLVTSLWFVDCAEEAVNFYVSIFKNSAIKRILRYSEAGPEAVGSAEFRFSPAISLVVNCTDQAEMDAVWEQLAADPSEGQCGWLEDKYGWSWQIVTPQAIDSIGSTDSAKAAAVTRAMFSMKKLDLAALQVAHDAA